MSAAFDTRITRLTGVRYPIVQTGMGWVAGPELTTATANAGGLGILTSGTISREEMIANIRQVKEGTDRPFGVNLVGSSPDVEERAKALIAEGVTVASFALAPKERVFKLLKDAGLVVIPSIGARRHAEKVAAWGADAVLVQGGEGGGHTGSVPTSVLLPQVVDAVDLPVIAAGGYYDGRGLVSAMAYGAEAIAMGTRFLLTSDTLLPAHVKQAYLDAGVDGTVVTSMIDGAPQRVLRTPMVERLTAEGRGPRALLRAARSAVALKSEVGSSWGDMIKQGREMRKQRELTWTQLMLAANTPMMIRTGMVEGNIEMGSLASGQIAGLIEELPSCAELIEQVMAQAEATLARLGGAA